MPEGYPAGLPERLGQPRPGCPEEGCGAAHWQKHVCMKEEEACIA